MVQVLILDDSPEMGQLAALILEAEGYDCFVTDDSYEAWALLHTLPFDVLTQDNMRPDIDGIEFYHLVRADARLASLAVLILSAVPLPATPEEVYDADLDAYLTKPFRRRDLVATVADALLSRGKEVPVKPGKGPAITPALLFRRLRGERREVQAASLVEQLGAEHPQERLRAARALGQRGDGEAVEPLLAALLDADAGVRLSAALALGRIGAERAADRVTMLLGDGDECVRMVAARALGTIGQAGAAAALVERLDDDSEWVRRATMQALGEIEAPEAIPALVGILRGPAEALRQAAGRALGHIGRPAVDALIAAIGSDDPAVRTAAILGLSRVEEDGRVDRALIEALHDDDERVRRAAAGALGDRDPGQVVAPLVTALQDTSPDVVAMAATALAWTGQAEAIPALERVAREDTRRTTRGEPVAEAARTAIRWIKSNH